MPPGCPVDTVAVPEGAALGAAFLARMAAGLESDSVWRQLGEARPDHRSRTPLGDRRLRPLPPCRGARPAGVSGRLRPAPARRLPGWG